MKSIKIVWANDQLGIKHSRREFEHASKNYIK
jgi:hypothetical protein